jgi:hypothetical protein
MAKTTKISGRVANLRVEIRTSVLQNTKQEATHSTMTFGLKSY